ncbi:dTDP-4-dehydrorhamnose 3,5-epimerase family protein [Mycobacterium sp. NPDC050041]|uniref:dTDP-4-dehydrorhamnose 3,5-epimerase family protein n=1 Tax=Mycobacterium sp. NPDC050041 TaxID=3364293 RepID=UPI003C2F1B93
MTVRELAVPGAWEITPTVHTDNRGAFFEWFTDRSFRGFAGHGFDLAQANCSVSAAGVLRGVHFSELPPSQAKYITCISGAVLDIVIDIRLGSPTFGRWDSVVLDDHNRRSMYLSEGLGHAFLSLRDGSTVAYLCSTAYAPDREHTINPLDPALGVDWSYDGELVLSDRDAAAPSLAEVEAAGLLPKWADTQAYVEELRRS